MTTEQYVSVRTKLGNRNHKAHKDDPRETLCGYYAWFTRKGGSWYPEFPREWDHSDECNRCERYSGTGNA